MGRKLVIYVLAPLVWAVCVSVYPPDAGAQTDLERWFVLHCGTLLSIPGDAPVLKVSVIVKGDRVYEVRNGFVDPTTIERPAGVEVVAIDLRDAFVLPGLIDAHTHVSLDSRPQSPWNALDESEADVAIRSVRSAENLLRAGVTTARDLGSSGRAVFALRDAIAEGVVPGPRLIVAGEPISPTGGHSDETLGYPDELLPTPGAEQGIADGPIEARKAVRAQVKRGADVIKLTATGGVLSRVDSGTGLQFFDDELRAIVDTAHLLGRKVAAHAHGVEGVKAALRAGVDSIEHGAFLDDEAIELFLKTGAFLVPTVLAGETVAERAKTSGYYPRAVERKALEVGPQLKVALQRAHARGVRIAFGTDSGVSPHGENARELAYMVESGMKEMDVIVAATRSSAELLGLSQEIGTIEPGKLADLIATQRNPLVDITELQRVRFVMKDGQVLVEQADIEAPRLR